MSPFPDKRIYRLFRISALLFFFVFPVYLLFHYHFWNLLTRIYVVAATLFLLYRFVAWFYADVNPPKKYVLSPEPYSIIIPVKDEDPTLFRKVVDMAVQQNGEKEVLIGDDGSKTAIKILLSKYPELYKNVKVFRSEKNRGKKHTQVRLIERAKYDVIVEIDSDVVLENEKVVQSLITPLQDKMIAIIAGNVRLFNPRKTVLNRIQSMMYYCQNQIGSRSWGNLGFNPVASGQLLALRKSVFMPFVKEYLNKTFLGNPITFGEDRLMTNLLLRGGYRSVYVAVAKARTASCETWKKYFKQQVRWRRSGIRESFFLLAFSKNPYLLALTFSRLVLPFVFTVLLATSLLSSLLVGYWFYIFIIFGVLILVTIISDIPLLLENYRRLPDLLLFALCNVLVLSPLWLYALLTLDKTTWGTR
ncbi:MAG TPA: glycosyltransferase [Candidatus Nanoarchaeia archaeon]|nr:glycosyltransferase [Candidatus Nanoarchaeia archaeon]